MNNRQDREAGVPQRGGTPDLKEQPLFKIRTGKLWMGQLGVTRKVVRSEVEVTTRAGCRKLKGNEGRK